MTTLCRFINAGFSLTNGFGFPLFQGDLRLISFNVNLGIGDGSAVLDLDLAVDSCIGAGGVGAPGVGGSAFFRSLTTDFEFNGIINSGTYTEGPNGRLLKYKITDPKKLLDNVYVLLKDYYCPINLPNFISFINLQEGNSPICPPGIDTENWPRVGGCNGYGSSGIGTSSSQNGVSLVKVFQRISTLPVAIYTTSGEALRLDLSRMGARLAVFAPWSKTDSTGMSLGALVAQAAEDSGCDYLVTLERGKFVTVWPIDRSAIIGGNPIASILAGYRQTGTLLNSEEGEQELYEPANKILIGDKVSYISEVDCRGGRASMMLGYDVNGTPIRANGTNFSAFINTSSLRSIPGLEGFPDMTRISEREILCAKTQEMWMLYGHCMDPNSLSGQLLNILGINTLLQDANILGAFNAMVTAVESDTVGGWKEKFETLKSINTFAAKRLNFVKYVECWKWFGRFIDEYYGKKWLVPIKNFCLYPANTPPVLIGDGGPYQISDVPTDSGYPSAGQQSRGILQLAQNNALLFEAADGKYNGFVRVNLGKSFIRRINRENIRFGISLDNFSAGSFVKQGNDIYVKTTLEGEIHGNFGTPEVLVSCNMIPMSPVLDGGSENDFVNKGLQAMAALFGVSKFRDRMNGEGYGNISKLNIFQLNYLAGDIDFAAVPMKSNMYVYGPWIGTKGGVTGSTEVVVDPQLNPWNYGSMSAMSVAGQALANMGLRLNNKEFTGSFTVAEPPGLSVRDFVINYGILVSNINVVYGSNGVTTNVSFKTFVPRFGQYGKALADVMLENNKARSQTLAYFKEFRRKNMNEMYTIYTNMLKEVTKVDRENGIVGGTTPYFIMIGGNRGNKNNNSGSGGSSFAPVSNKKELSCEEICNPETDTPSEPSDGGQSLPKIVDVELEKGNMAELSYQGASYKLRSIMSLDGLFAPVSLNGRDGFISRYFSSYDSSLNIAKPRPPMPPFDEKLTINQKYLNPIVSTQILKSEWDGRGVSKDGFYVQYIGFGEDITKIRDEKERNNASDFGFFALKGPLVLQAWGYDTEGKPIPNIVDSPADTERGVFKNDGTKNKFMTNWLENQKTWPVGPIDLRFDRARGVWVSPPQERIVVAQLLTSLSPYGSAEAALLNPGSTEGVFYENYAIYGPNGENVGTKIEQVKITVCDFLGRNLCTGTKIYAYYNDNKYIVLESSAVDEVSCDLCDCESSESSSSESSSSESESCSDVCGLQGCLTSLGDGPGVLGLDEKGCLTLYGFTECQESAADDGSGDSSDEKSGADPI